MGTDSFINELGVFRAGIKRVFEREQKGQSKPACYVEFERLNDQAICSMRFSNPMMTSDLFRASKLIREITGKLFKVDALKKKTQKDLLAYLNGFKGECVNIYVRPSTFMTKDGYEKTFYSVEDVVSGKFEPSQPAISKEDFEAGFGEESDNTKQMAAEANFNKPPVDDDIPF